jgi:hypothetical protein
MKTLGEYLHQEEICGLSNANWLKKRMGLKAVPMDGTVHCWPAPHKNVFAWWLLETGHAVGFNENPSHGWTFPNIRFTPEQFKYYAHLFNE